ncbi:hypothetical protein NDA15_000849 [Ustilago hordei]|nr:hypothetical protein NDA15_000849 [Ustilago hordei]
MTDPDLNNKLDRLLTLLEAQLELTRQDEQEDINYEKYASPTGPRYVKTKVDPYRRTRTDPYPLDHEEDTSIMAELNRSKPIATPFPKFNPQDMEIFILEAKAWFKFNQVYEQTRMINHMGAQLEGTAREWWTSKLCIDRAREGRLFNDWHYFTERLSEQFNPHNARMEAYNKLAKHSHEEDQAQGAGTATRRTKLKEQAQPRRGPSSRSMQMVTTQGLERQEPKELSLIKGGGAVSKESTPGHEEEEQCRRS